MCNQTQFVVAIFDKFNAIAFGEGSSVRKLKLLCQLRCAQHQSAVWLTLWAGLFPSVMTFLSSYGWSQVHGTVTTHVPAVTVVVYSNSQLQILLSW